MSKKKSRQPYQVRIVGEGEADPRKLKANSLNWRTHSAEQRKALKEVLSTVGYVVGVLVNKRTGNLIDGHLRVDDAIDEGQAKIPVTYCDLSEAEEKLILASFDTLTLMAGVDQDQWELLIDQTDLLSEATADLFGDVLGLEDLAETVASAESSAASERAKEAVESDAGTLTDDEREALHALAGWRTAIARKETSAPMRWFEDKGLLKGKVLDYGAGRDRHEHEKFDPAWHPAAAPLLKKWDTITCCYVLNVIPLEHSR